MSRGHWCETAALLPHVPGMGLGPWLWGDLQEREQRAQVDEGAEMKGDEKLHGGLGSCRALASQDGQHPTPTAGTENTPPPPPPFHSHGNHSIPLLPPIPFPRQLQNSPTLYPIPMATAASCSHSRVQGTHVWCWCHSGFSRSPLPEGQRVAAQRSLGTQCKPVLISLGVLGGHHEPLAPLGPMRMPRSI